MVSTVLKRKLKINDQLTLRLFKPDLPLKNEIQPKAEDKDKLPLFMKYSAIGHVATIVLILIMSLVINKFFKSEKEPVVVKVFQQKPEVKKQKIIKVSKRKVIKRTRRKARVSKKTRVAKNTRLTKRRSNRTLRKASQNIKSMGALGVLGGFSKKMNGSGGLNVKAAKNNAGYSYGGKATRGGNSRALVGKGLVASGLRKQWNC